MFRGCLYHLYCNHINLHYSYPIYKGRHMNMLTQSLTHTFNWDAWAKRCLLWFGLVMLLTLKRDNYICCEAPGVCAHVCIRCAGFELRTLSREKLLWQHKITWSISCFSLCQGHFMWWWFDTWGVGSLLLYPSGWSIIVRAGIAGITELIDSSHQNAAVSLRCPWQMSPVLNLQFPLLFSTSHLSQCLNSNIFNN